MGSGSELSLCVEAADKLNAAGIKTRVVSMPSWELFEQQDAAYKESVFPASVSARVSVEMLRRSDGNATSGSRAKMIGMRSFGASAPLKGLLKKSASRWTTWWRCQRSCRESEPEMKIVVGSDHAGFQFEIAVGRICCAPWGTMSWMSVRSTKILPTIRIC